MNQLTRVSPSKLGNERKVFSGGASPLFVAGQSQVISRIRKGSQHIDIRATFYEF